MSKSDTQPQPPPHGVLQCYNERQSTLLLREHSYYSYNCMRVIYQRSINYILDIWGEKRPVQCGESQVNAGSVVNHVTATAGHSSVEWPAMTKDIVYSD